MPSSFGTKTPVIYTLSTRDYRNNMVLNGVGEVRYWIETELPHEGMSTHLYRASRTWADSKDLVATVEFVKGGAGFITYDGETRGIDEVFPRKSWIGSKRLMLSPYGECKWTREGKLFGPSGDLMASYAPNRRAFRRSSAPTISVTSEAAYSFMDTIVLGWMVMMHTEERR
ncbi:hypothetical protein DL93DRAFT_849432 [Clavulina sp. PMI_390]|nr:hypothetical protein DL93DRAFT_849432 [Clavulina sp. PMI_390]